MVKFVFSKKATKCEYNITSQTIPPYFDVIIQLLGLIKSVSLQIQHEVVIFPTRDPPVSEKKVQDNVMFASEKNGY